MWKKISDYVRGKYNNLEIIDKYISKQVIQMFMMGVVVFTTILFASDTFITLVKQISKFGIPFKIAFIMILLSLPSVIVLTIPMGVLLATVMTLNRLSLSSEITVMRSCGVGLNRIAKPIFIFAIVMAISSFFINESVVPSMMRQSKKLALWSLAQKNVPNGKENYVFKELNENDGLKRLFYVGKCEKGVLYNVTVLDNSEEGMFKIIHARQGKSSPDGWNLDNSVAYVIDEKESILNTSMSESLNYQLGVDLTKEMDKNMAKEMNFLKLLKFLNSNDITKKNRRIYTIELFDKIALPLTTVVFVLVGVPLAITPPRVRYNRGFLFSILIIFAYYVIRALSISLGEAGSIPPFLSAWLPNIILAVWGAWLYYKKVYTIE